MGDFASTKHYSLSFWATRFARFTSLSATPENETLTHHGFLHVSLWCLQMWTGKREADDSEGA